MCYESSYKLSYESSYEWSYELNYKPIYEPSHKSGYKLSHESRFESSYEPCFRTSCELNLLHSRAMHRNEQCSNMHTNQVASHLVLWDIRRTLVKLQDDLHLDASQLNWQLRVVWRTPSSCHLLQLHQQLPP